MTIVATPNDGSSRREINSKLINLLLAVIHCQGITYAAVGPKPRRLSMQRDEPLCNRLPPRFVSMPVFRFLVRIEVAPCATTLGNDTPLVCNDGTTIGNIGNSFPRSSDIPPDKTYECHLVRLLKHR